MYCLQLDNEQGEALEGTLTTGDGSNRAATEATVAVTTSTASNNTGVASCGVSGTAKRRRSRAGESRSRAWDNSKSAKHKRKLYRASESGYNADLKSAAARQPCLGKTRNTRRSASGTLVPGLTRPRVTCDIFEASSRVVATVFCCIVSIVSDHIADWISPAKHCYLNVSRWTFLAEHF